MHKQDRTAPRGIGSLVVGLILVLLAGLVATTTGRQVAEPDSLAPASDSDESGRISVLHNPPLLTLPGEPVVLSFDIICAAERRDEECPRQGIVHVRADGEKEYQSFDLLVGGDEQGYRLFAALPPRFVESGGFTYYAELGPTEEPIRLPAGGPRAPHRAWTLNSPEHITLGPQTFEPDRAPDGVAVSGAWGTGPGEFGIEPGDESLPIGPSSFDVTSDGTISVMDPVNERLALANPDGTVRHVPLPVTSALPDIAVDALGNVHVLESSAPDDGTPPLNTFAPDGTLVTSTRIAESIPSKVRIGPTGPYVYQYPSAMWMPVLDEAGRTLSLVGQIRRELPGLLDVDGFATVVKVTNDELRIARVDVDGVHVAESWRITAPSMPLDAAFGEVQLAEPDGDGILAVVAVYTDTHDAFRVLHLSEGELVDDFTVDRAAYTETASVSRFRVGPEGDLYQLRSSEAGAEVIRFAIGREER